MKLDRYSTKVPKFRVFRHAGTTASVDEIIPPGRPDHAILQGENGIYVEVDPWECFVLKRRDIIARFMIGFGSITAQLLGDKDYGKDLDRLLAEWQAKSINKTDSK